MARGSGSAAAAKKKNGGKASTRSSGAPWKPPRAVALPIDQVLAANAALRDALESLGATRPTYVVGKQLKKSDVNHNQARLLFSCKGGPLRRSPLVACFTEPEARRVRDKDAGLLVTALDRGGRSYDLTCKYLASNDGYRFIAGWTRFLYANGLMLGGNGSFQRDVHVELWAFRSRALPNRLCDDVNNKDGGKEKIREETGHPDGALGLVLLHYERAVEHAGGDDQEEERMVDDEPMMLTAATPQEGLLDGGGDGEEERMVDDEPMMPADEMVAKFGEKMALAAIGLYMLKRDRWVRVRRHSRKLSRK